MNKNDAVRLRHMIDAGREALSFSAGKTRKDLDIVWQTVTNELPVLICELETSLLRMGT